MITFIAGALKTTREVVKKDLAKRYNINKDKIISVDVIEDCHRALWQAKPLLKELYARGVTDHDIRLYRLGAKEGRVTIPVKNEALLYVNMRLYLPGAPGADKFRNLKGRGEARVFPIEQLAYPKLLLVGGEIKAIVGAAHLNKHGIGVVTSTLGETNWDPKLTHYFKGKPTTVCYDIDEEGVKSQENTCKHLSLVTEVRTTKLQLDPVKFPKGDINDFVMIGGNLLETWNSSEEFKGEQRKDFELDKPIRLDLVDAINAKNTAKRVLITATVSTLDTSPYVVPKTIKVKCDRQQDVCAICSIFTNDPLLTYSIPRESPTILEIVARPKSNQAMAFKEELQIPKKCMSCEFEATAYYNVEDARISPRLEITDRAADKSMQPAIIIGKGLDLNETYEMVGRQYPHPLTQQSTLLISKYKASQDALSSYRCDKLEQLKLFQPTEWTAEALDIKLRDIWKDFELNVTQIYGRPEIHAFVDLAYHSPLFITFDEKKIKGWVEVLIVGDSAQGKTETAMNLRRHYRLGEKVECKNASVAGLLGGLQQMGTRWFVSWGIIPTHDKRLVILEELKGTSIEVISKLTDMRSSGIAEIPKIEKRRTHARTRLIALSNPRSDNPIQNYSYGVEALKELIGSLEDLRRFDACLLVASKDVDHNLINQRIKPQEPKYASELCQALILWAWTAKDTIFEQETVELILKFASEMSDKFTDSIPLVDRGSMRYKLARMSASLAARTFSTTEDGKILVRPCHVQWLHSFLDNLYSTKTFGYLDLTKSVHTQNSLQDPDLIRKGLINTPFPQDLVANLLARTHIELQDIQDWCSWDRSTAQELLSLLVRKHALQRRQRSYLKTSAFIIFLKGLELPKRPDYVPEGAEF